VTSERGGPEQLAESYRDPRQAITERESSVSCAGVAFRHLTNTHLAGHGLTASEYKRLFGYNAGRPLMCGALVRLYAEHAVRVGLAAGIRRRPILEDPRLRRTGGARAIALEEILTRRDVHRGPRRPWNARDGRGRFAHAPSDSTI
jgi:hypothetical protein